MAITPFKMKGHMLPGVKQRSSTTMDDGRAKSSTFQKAEEEEKVKDVITGTKENPIWTKSKGGKSSSYTINPTYSEKTGGKGTRWVNPECGSFITTTTEKKTKTKV